MESVKEDAKVTNPYVVHRQKGNGGVCSLLDETQMGGGPDENESSGCLARYLPERLICASRTNCNNWAPDPQPHERGHHVALYQ